MAKIKHHKGTEWNKIFNTDLSSSGCTIYANLGLSQVPDLLFILGYVTFANVRIQF